ncbi:hypothetical protein [Polaromonas sp.]|uniref:hypothetical protein n=1 Tax=Polaromonas sp. TaxID=1869339 RepID=UPI002869F6DB|nr:hypothetical protein [Polaromonas sp.]
MIVSESPPSFYRTALNFALEYNHVLLQGAQRVRRYQIEQIDAAMADYGKLSRKLDQAFNSEQLLTTGPELAVGQLERSLGYWNGLSSLLGQNQLELAGVFQSRTAELADSVKQQLDQASGAIPVPLAATLNRVAEVVHNTLITAQQLMPSPQPIGARHPGRGQHAAEPRAQH